MTSCAQTFAFAIFFLCLPSDIELKSPFPMEEGKREVHYTYLDTVGRPVIVARKTNLVEQHIQDFEVRLVLSDQEFCQP